MNDPPLPDVHEPTEEELEEGHRRLETFVDSVPIESYTCFGCVGRRLKAESTDEDIATWSDLEGFGAEKIKTLCPLAWDPYNTDGDCLALK